MEKQEVVAYLIMENTTDPVKPKNLQVFDKGGLFYVKFETFLQEFDAFNRNRRNYASDPMMSSLEAPHIQELVRKNSWCGESGHPMSDDPKRILTIDPKLLSHRINWFRLQGKMLRGEIESLDDGMYGTQFTKHILQGMEPAFSLRALASLIKQQDGTALMRSRCHVVTYDSVILPSHSKAYRDETKPIQKIYKGLIPDGNGVTESLIPVTESAAASIGDFIKLESKNVKLVSNVYEVAMESLNLTPDLKYAILKEGTQTYAIKIEDRIKYDIMNFTSKL